jgi:hypothetical protein
VKWAFAKRSTTGVVMSALAEAIRLIEQEIVVKRARCVIADEGWPGESSLLGTRDGYLNLALALLRYVAEADAGGCRDAKGEYAWDDRIKTALYQLPTNSAWLVGTFLFRNHAEFMASLSRLVGPQVEYPLLNDPQFQDPELQEACEAPAPARQKRAF